MKNFLISSVVNLALISMSYFVFKSILSGPTRHKLYEVLLGSMSRYVIYVFLATVVVTGLTALVLYKTRYISYINIVAPALLSLLIGFLMCTVPTRGEGDNKKIVK